MNNVVYIVANGLLRGIRVQLNAPFDFERASWNCMFFGATWFTYAHALIGFVGDVLSKS